MEIIKAGRKDFQDIYAIIHECSIWLKNEKGMDHWINYYTEDLVKTKFNNHTEIFLLKVDDKYIGTISLSTKEPLYYTKNTDGENGRAVNYINEFSKGKSVYISSFAVLPEYQGRGYGKYLLSFAETYSKEKGSEFLRLDARGDYNELIQMYTKLGFEKVGSMPEPDSEYLLMEKKINL